MSMWRMRRMESLLHDRSSLNSRSASRIRTGEPRAAAALHLLELLLDPLRHRLERATGAAERALPRLVQQVVLAAASAALFRRHADIRDHHLLACEPGERDVDA